MTRANLAVPPTPLTVPNEVRGDDAMSAVRVRFAEGSTDLAWCLAHDGWVDEAQLRPKIEAREVVPADHDGELVGLFRLHYLWSALPHKSWTNRP